MSFFLHSSESATKLFQLLLPLLFLAVKKQENFYHENKFIFFNFVIEIPKRSIDHKLELMKGKNNGRKNLNFRSTMERKMMSREEKLSTLARQLRFNQLCRRLSREEPSVGLLFPFSPHFDVISISMLRKFKRRFEYENPYQIHQSDINRNVFYFSPISPFHGFFV